MWGNVGSILWMSAAHEFGHSLGLDHTDDKSALMYPFYTEDLIQLQALPYHDKQRISDLYGKLDLLVGSVHHQFKSKSWQPTRL